MIPPDVISRILSDLHAPLGGGVSDDVILRILLDAGVGAGGRIVVGDCLHVLRGIPSRTVDAIVSDVPYGLGTREPTVEEIVAYLGGAELDTGGDFMGKRWSVPSVQVWRECLRVLKPGGHALAFGGTRTFDLIALGMRAAGFEFRDSISSEGVLRWTYGQGFPHSVDVGRQVDMEKCTLPGRHYDKTLPTGAKAQPGDHLCPPHADAEPYRGRGTALKSAWEPILVMRRPLEDTVARTALEWGTGGINIDGCRVPFVSKEDEEEEAKKKNQHADFGSGPRNNRVYGKYKADRLNYDTGARWPANVVLDESVSEAMGESSRVFFRYIAKASRSEREAGCELLPARSGAAAVEREEGSAGTRSPRAGAGRTAKEVRNHHVSVKPIALMRWLVRLVTPPGGLVLDPYAGSGSTGCAAALEGRDFLLIEREPEYAAIAQARVAHWSRIAKKADR